MWDGMLILGNSEVINKERTAKHVAAMMPNLTVKCDDANGLYRILGDAPYVLPSSSSSPAPWYTSTDPATAEFAGFWPTSVTGDVDSTRQVDSTELLQDGGLPGMPRYGSREIRIRGLLFATTSRGIEAGMRYMRNMLDDHTCGRIKVGCDGVDMALLTQEARNSTQAEADAILGARLRTMYRVWVLSNVRKVGVKGSTSGYYVWEVEFILSAGVPWQFTSATVVATTSGKTPVTATEFTCPTIADAYDQLIVDPADPNVLRPPRPPLVNPYPLPSSMQRYSGLGLQIPAPYGATGRVVPIIDVTTSASADRTIRIRIVPSGLDVCNFECEFLVTYVPANSRLTIDGRTRRITVYDIAGGFTRPGANLVSGSDGRPATWSAMSCGGTYNIYVDTPDALGSTQVSVSVAVRE